ncbi:ABA4-like family protein [uncultured Microscilla sp.]|uniref:ABA4-like family protein n=1 Tax=uncultured Microscilla sp. TaxID=432653 RepID=UPI002624A19F|nr:ABA4-like family protein [uncultured Microscilla sp.]
MLENLFTLVNTVALVGWLLLIFAPGWQWTRRIVLSLGISLFFAIIYVVMFALNIAAFKLDSFSTLAGVMNLFTAPQAVLIGWVHYLAFDLFVGCWEVSNAQKTGVPHKFVIPCLLFTFMLGPTGLLMYWVVRQLTVKPKMEANF